MADPVHELFRRGPLDQQTLDRLYQSAQDPVEVRQISGDEAELDFLSGRSTFFVKSSWCVWASYDIQGEELTIAYHSGHRGVYGLSPEDALAFIRAPSRGKWVHTLRVGWQPDGRRWIHRCPYRAG